MKRKAILMWLLAAMCHFAGAQDPAGGLRPIDLTLVTGKKLTADQIMPGPILLIYFSPDCEHCIKFTEAFLKEYSSFPKMPIVMASFLPLKNVQEFAAKFNLTKYSNISVGTENNALAIRNAYNVKMLPYVALFDGNRKLVDAYEGEKPVSKILKAVKKLNP